MTLVPTPAYASCLNRIECHFGVMVKAVFAGSDYQDHEEIQAAVASYLGSRNAEAAGALSSVGPPSRPAEPHAGPSGTFGPCLSSP